MSWGDPKPFCVDGAEAMRASEGSSDSSKVVESSEYPELLEFPESAFWKGMRDWIFDLGSK